MTACRAIHATAVAIAGEALLIRGPSRAGKSRLALAMIACSTRRRPITLVGDDRILLSLDAAGVTARPHQRIAGFVERRGLGIVAIPWTARAPVAGIVDLGHPAQEPVWLDGIPRLEVAAPCAPGAEATRILAWWAMRGAACTPHPPVKASAAFRSRAKDWNW